MRCPSVCSRRSRLQPWTRSPEPTPPRNGGPGLGPPSHRGPRSAALPGWKGMKDLWTAGPSWQPPPEALKRLSCCTLKSWRPGRAVLNLAASKTCTASIFLTGLWERMWPTGRGLAARKYGESAKVYVGPFPLPSLTPSGRHP